MTAKTKTLLDRLKNIIQFYGNDDKSEIKKFLSKYFHSKYVLMDDDFFDWQYLNNPNNFYKGYSIKIIKEKNNLLGYLGLVPFKLKVFEKSYANCGALCNLMIDTACRAMGLGSILVGECQKDFLIITGTSYNPKTETMYKRIGNWFPMGHLNRYIFIINPKHCAMLENPDTPDYKKFEMICKKRLETSSLNKDLTFQEINKFGDNISDFWETVKKKYPIVVERNAEYLNWRFSNHPKLKYQIFIAKKQHQIFGYIVSRTEKTRERENTYTIGRLIDFIADKDSESFLLENYVQKMRQENIDFIDFFFTGITHVPILESVGFLNADKHDLLDIPYVFQPIERNRKHINFIIYIDDSLINLSEKIKDINNWYITRAEGDQDRPNIPNDRQE